MPINNCTNDDYGETYNIDFMKKCQLSIEDYTQTGPFIGTGSLNCTDPKILHSQASANFNNLGIEKISIFTYASNHNYENESLSIFNWVEAPYFLKRKCFTMIIPEDIIHEGIAKISITSNQLSVQIHIHELGLFNTDMTGASIKTSYSDLVEAYLSHEVLYLLGYDGKPCNGDSDFRLDLCRQQYIYEVH